MRKTSLYLDPELDGALTRRAAAQGISKAELVRRALREAVAESVQPRPRAVAVFEASPDLAEHLDKHLEGFGDT